MKNNTDTKPLVNPLNDVQWLKAKIAMWQKAENEAQQQLNAAQDQLKYYRLWLSEIKESEGNE